jgi:dTDP-4-dehydrorhamnose reductase
MKIAVIGANGNVGTELCFLLKEKDEVVPIVRNRMGSIFLQHHGLKCRIADISIDDDAQKTLHDVDVVVIAAWVADRFSGSQNQTSKAINEKLIKNSVRFSTKNSTIIYLSTIRAFAHKVDPKTSRFWPPRYDKEKQHLERVLVSECQREKKKGVAFRCGHVFGEHQPSTKAMKKLLSGRKKLVIQANSDWKSNIVHIVTLNNAIFRCIQPDVKPGVYSIVNNPQWTWKEVYENYNKNSQIEFKPAKQVSRNISNSIWKILKSNKKLMVPILYRMPKSFEKHLLRKLSMRRIKMEISMLNDKEYVFSGNFNYVPMPGPFLAGLADTRELLKKYSPEIFKTS